MKLKHLVLLALALFIMYFPGMANAGPLPHAKIYNLQLFQEDKVLNSPTNRESYWIEFKNGIKPGGKMFVDLWYSYSQTIIPELSTISVFFNDVPLGSRYLKKVESMPVNWRIEIPPEIVNKGFNELRIMTTQRSIEELCQDVDNTANWLIIHANSVLHLELEEEEYSLKNYPYPFLDSLGHDSVNSIFQAPSKPEPYEIEAILRLAGDWGRRESTGNFKKIGVRTGVNDNLRSPRVMVGHIEEWNDEKASLPSGTGIVSLHRNPTALLVSGTDEKGLARASKSLTRPQIVRQFQGNTEFVIDEPAPARGSSPTGKYTLEDLGFSDIELSGAFHNRTGIIVRRPAGYEVGTRSRVKLFFRHSGALKPDQSCVTIYVNGRPVKSQVLDASNEENGILEVNFPPGELDAASWLIEFAFYHDLGKVDCSKRYDEIAWSVVEKDTTIYLAPGKAGNNKTMDGFPFLGNINNNGTVKATMWLSEKPTDNELSLAALIAALAGQDNPATIEWKVITGSKIPPKESYDALIALGFTGETERWNALEDYLSVNPHENGKFTKKENIDVMYSALEEAVLCQALQFTGGKTGYAFMVPGDEQMQILKNILADTDRAGELGGILSLVDKQGQIIPVSGVEQPGQRPAKNPYLRKVEGATWAYVVVFLTVIFATGLTLWLVKRRVR